MASETTDAAPRRLLNLCPGLLAFGGMAVPFQEVPRLGLGGASAPALTLQLRPIAP